MNLCTCISGGRYLLRVLEQIVLHLQCQLQYEPQKEKEKGGSLLSFTSRFLFVFVLLPRLMSSQSRKSRNKRALGTWFRTRTKNVRVERLYTFLNMISLWKVLVWNCCNPSRMTLEWRCRCGNYSNRMQKLPPCVTKSSVHSYALFGLSLHHQMSNRCMVSNYRL